MKITFAGTVIAQEPTEAGTDAVAGFLIPGGKQNIEWSEPIRASDATPIARGNRKHTLTGTIIPAPSASLQAAMVVKGLLFISLPTTGPLIFQISGTQVTFPVAVLESIAVLKDATRGVSYGYQLTFQANAPVQSNLVITTENGLQIKTESGQTISS